MALENKPLKAEYATTLQSSKGKTMHICVGSPANTQKKGTLVCLHPHPLKQGNMFNKVITTAVKTALDEGCKTIRFNFSAIDDRQKMQSLIEQSLEDLDEVLNWMGRQGFEKPYHLLGFSFGAQIALEHQNKESRLAILIAPAITTLKAMQAANMQKTAVILAKQDELFDYKEAQKHCNHCLEKALYSIDASHFFHQKLQQLSQVLQNIFHRFMA